MIRHQDTEPDQVSQTLTVTVQFLMAVSMSSVTVSVSIVSALVVVSSVAVSMIQAAVEQRVAVTVT